MAPNDSNSLNPRTVPIMPPVAPSSAGDSAPAPAGPSGLSGPPGVADLWYALRRRWLAAVGMGLLLGGLGAAVAWQLTPAKFSAQALLRVDSHAPRGLSENGEDFANYQRTVQTQVKSYEVAKEAMGDPDAPELAEAATPEGRVEWLQTQGAVDTLLGPEVLRLTVTADRADEAAAVANAWARSCEAVLARQETARLKDRIAQLKKDYDDKTARLGAKKVDLRTKEADFGVDDAATLKVKLDAAVLRNEQLKNQLDQLEIEQKHAKAELADLNARLAKPETLPVLASAVEEEADKELKQDGALKPQFDLISKYNADIAAVKANAFPEDQPALIQAIQKKIDAVEASIKPRKEALRPGVEARLRVKAADDLRAEADKTRWKLKGVEEDQQTVTALLDKQRGLIADLRAGGKAGEKVSPVVEGLRAEVEQLDAGLKSNADEQGKLEAAISGVKRVTVMETAGVPKEPKRDRQWKTAGGVGLALFGLAFVGVALVEFSARRVSRANDVAQRLGLPLVGTVPAPSRKATSPAAADPADQGPMMESVDAIRTLLLHAGRSSPLRVLMVASAVGGEGKTTLASQLAASLARGGRKTLLVDCDLRNPAAHKPFGLQPGPGFAELLRAEREPHDVVQTTPVENLDLLAAGGADRRALAALANDGALQAVFAELREQYDFLVVDVCPVLPVTDALLIGRHADAVLLAVLRNVSRLPQVHAAQQRLAALGIRTLGAVVLGEDAGSYGSVRYPVA
jgi:capsular exopolysaccharide synthesis family protein